MDTLLMVVLIGYGVLNMKLTITEINVETGEEITYERDETPEEKKSRLETKAIMDAKEAEFIAKETARQEILDRLGLTADEAKLLLG